MIMNMYSKFFSFYFIISIPLDVLMILQPQTHILPISTETHTNLIYICSLQYIM